MTLYISDLILLLGTENTSSPGETTSGSIGAAVGGVAALLVLGAIGVVFARKRKLVEKEAKVQTNDEGKQNYQLIQLFVYYACIKYQLY